MNSKAKIPTLVIALVAFTFGFGIFTLASDAFAWAEGTDDGQGGCCGGSMASHSAESYSYTPPTSSGCGSDCNPPVKKYGKCDAFTASPTTLSHGGGDVTLSWNTTNAESVSINQGIGNVSHDGSKTVHVTTSKTFVLTVDGKDGDDTCQVSVTVKEKAHLSCDLFTVSKSKVEKGESFTLRWETTGATSVTINQGIGSVSSDGSRTESTNSDKSYTLTASNSEDTVTCHTSVKIEEEEDDDLRCELDISDDEIKRGDSVKLSWETEGGDEILLKDDRGNVLVDTDDGDNYDVDEDEIRVKPTRDTEYKLTVFDGSKKETCEVEVEVEEKNVSVDVDRDQKPVVIGIPLTHVPYTGFEAGPVLTALFYTLLAIWGLAIAYILVVKRGSVFGFAIAEKAGEVPVATASVSESSFAVPAATLESTMGTIATSGTEDLVTIDNRAHEARVLLSTDARQFIIEQANTLDEQLTVLDSVIASAKAKFPTDNGWVVLNKARIEELIG